VLRAEFVRAVLLGDRLTAFGCRPRGVQIEARERDRRGGRQHESGFGKHGFRLVSPPDGLGGAVAGVQRLREMTLFH
jgi:hypothetical protein